MPDDLRDVSHPRWVARTRQLQAAADGTPEDRWVTATVRVCREFLDARPRWLIDEGLLTEQERALL